MYDYGNKQSYDRLDCFPDKFEQCPTCMKVFKLLAACFNFPTSIQTCDNVHGQMYDHVDGALDDVIINLECLSLTIVELLRNCS